MSSSSAAISVRNVSKKYVIRHDGGTGTFKTVTLDSTAYEALYNKRADFTIPFTAWEGVEAQERGIKLRYFAFTDYGFPDFYQVVLACDSDWLSRDPDAARRFVGATVRGFELAAKEPDAAAQMLIDENPGAFDANPALPKASAEFLASGNYYVDSNGKVGTQTLEKWKGYSGFLFEQDLLVDGAGKPVKSPPDYSALFTNDFPAVMGVTILASFFIIMANLVIDIFYAYLDPRIRYQ